MSEVQGSSEAVVESTSTPAVESAPATESVATPEVSSAEKPVDATPAEAPAYSPNFKVKAYGKEYEVPEELRGFYKDKQAEEILNKNFSKAYAFDELLEKNKGLQTRHSELEKGYNDFYSRVQKPLEYLEKKDLDNFFKSINLSEDDILQHALHLVQLSKLEPNQRKAYDEQISQRSQYAEMEKQNQYLQKQYEQLSVQTRTIELQTKLSNPEVGAFSQAFDAKMGRPGAFMKAVIDHGRAKYAMTNGEVDLSVDEAVQEVMGSYAPFVGVGAQQPMAQQMAAQTTPPVIPNIQGKQTSPTKRVFNSLDDIRKYAEERQAQTN